MSGHAMLIPFGMILLGLAILAWSARTKGGPTEREMIDFERHMLKKHLERGKR